MDNKSFFNGLKKHFNITTPNKFLDITMLSVGKVKVDVFAFDDWLHNKHGEYEIDEGLSMKEVISKYYGKSAASFIEKMI